MIKAFVTIPIENRGMKRIEAALRRYHPEEVEIVETEDEADLFILYAYRHRRSTQSQANVVTRAGKKYAVMQICLRDTLSPNTKDWLPIWQNAAAVWSYYDLERYIEEDGLKDDNKSNFYYAPLGADASVFTETYRPTLRPFVVASSGSTPGKESMREVIMAAQHLGRDIFHIGAKDEVRDAGIMRVTFADNLTDKEMAKMYSQCEFVSNLRPIEGFDMPAVEGLLCGARPISFDRPDARHWFEGLSEFIPEASDQQRVRDLIEIFRKGARPVTEEEKAIVRERFNWETLCMGFWKEIV